MALAEEKLKLIADQLKKGVAPPRETVRSFLLWFDAERRSYRIVNNIRIALKRHGLVTKPDFDVMWLDASISFELSRDGDAGVAPFTDPTYRVGRIDAANKLPVSVTPDSTLQQATTLMLANDFSQLPVMTGPRDVKGAVSWKTIGSRLALKRPCAKVRDCMESAHVVSADDSLGSVISKIAMHDYVLVQAKDRQITGIVTASDLNAQFQSLADPFLLVGEIESGVRLLLHGKFTVEDLESAKAPGDDGRAIQSPSDLTFGEYVRLLEPESRWQQLKLEVDRVTFLEQLSRVREIRNDVMHFDPDGLDLSDLVFLREFAGFLKRLRDVGAI
ncbi:CBS domain-containing protein [Burkholderia ubonensis]|uniref:CBS domain-containing protein n=1 Tax=Burkholderia ubonensis TaxID=101571 RepID=UPI0007C74EB1|nr:CBS domain-containing protein [Burkholderia ubonensis]